MVDVQIFDDKGHSGLLTSQMTPHYRATRKAVASSLSPQSLRYCLYPSKILALPASTAARHEHILYTAASCLLYAWLDILSIQQGVATHVTCLQELLPQDTGCSGSLGADPDITWACNPCGHGPHVRKAVLGHHWSVDSPAACVEAHVRWLGSKGW